MWKYLETLYNGLNIVSWKYLSKVWYQKSFGMAQ